MWTWVDTLPSLGPRFSIMVDISFPPALWWAKPPFSIHSLCLNTEEDGGS